MRAALMYGAGDVRIETVPDPELVQPTDALVRILRASVCGSDLHPYHQMPASLVYSYAAAGCVNASAGVRGFNEFLA